MPESMEERRWKNRVEKVSFFYLPSCPMKVFLYYLVDNVVFPIFFYFGKVFAYIPQVARAVLDDQIEDEEEPFRFGPGDRIWPTHALLLSVTWGKGGSL